MDTAIILTAALLDTADAKTAHGLIRESRRFQIIAVVDEAQQGRDAGEVLDGRYRNIPIYATVEEALVLKPVYCIVGVATNGGIFPDAMIKDVATAIQHGVSIINGLHDYLSEREDIQKLAAEHQVTLTDIRKPKKRSELHFWTGEIFTLKTPIVAVIGTDCTLGKRTTQRILMNACLDAGVNAQLVYTGQTGWLQGGTHGFIFDATLNDFVAGEIEHAILSCDKDTRPDVILLEGQSALRNPTGPCGSEFLVSGNAKHVILVHAPKRDYFDMHPAFGSIPSLDTEIELIKLYGSRVVAVAINTEGCTVGEAQQYKIDYEKQFGIPVSLPLQDGCAPLVPVIQQLIAGV